jgi:hypothetical protein
VTLGQAPQSFLFGSISGSWVAFALFGGIACFAGGATAAILRRFAARPGELPYYATTPFARRTLGVVVGGAILVGVWWWLWSGFYQLEAGREAVTLRFHVPTRKWIVPRAEIAHARWDAGPRSSRVLVVETRSGRVYRSMQTSSNDAFERHVTQAVNGTGAR